MEPYREFELNPESRARSARVRANQRSAAQAGYGWLAYVLAGVLLAFAFGSACQLHSTPRQATSSQAASSHTASSQASSQASSPSPEPAPNTALVTHVPACPVVVDSCSGASDSECLEPVVIPGSAASPIVYRYRDLRQWDDDGKLPLPHFLLKHVKDLRRAYWRAEPGSSVERRCLEQLRAQLAYLVGTLKARGPALVWENMHGYAQAMEQSEWAHGFASVASILGRKGHLDEAQRLFGVASRLARSLDLPAGPRSGGVRASGSTCTNSANESVECFWFHSRGLGIIAPPGPPVFVLNTQLHAIFDSLLLYETLEHNEAVLVHSASEANLERKRAIERAVGGLSQLAFAPAGQKSVDGAPRPNFESFLDRDEDLCAHGRLVQNVWAHYAIDAQTGQTADISRRGVCHYHAHVLQKLADIGLWLQNQDRKEFANTPAGRRLTLALERLLVGNTVLASSPTALTMFESAIEPAVLRARGCPQTSLVPEVLTSEAFYLRWLRKLAETPSTCGRSVLTPPPCH